MSNEARAAKALDEARRQLARGAPEHAARHCRDALAQTPGNPEARFLLGISALQRGDAEGAAAELAAAARSSPGNLDYLAALGDSHAARGAPAEAAAIYARVLDTAPRAGTVRARYAVALQQAGDPDRAIEHYEIAIRAEPGNPYLHFSLGTAHKQRRAFDDAIAAYRRAVDLAPDELRFVESLAHVLMERRHAKEGAAAFERALHLAPERAESWGGLCFCRMRAGDGAGAVEAAEGYARAAGAGPAADLWASHALLAAGRHEASLDAGARALGQTPACTAALADRALALAGLARPDEARAVADLDQLLAITTIDVPDGYVDLAAFNEALVAHLTGNPDLGFDTTSMSCHNGGTSDEVFDAPQGPAAALQDALERACARYRDRIAHLAHPWVRSAPQRLDLSGWCTVLRQGGYQHGHIHPTSWLSGVYYLRVPGREDGHDDRAGCIEFGRAPDHYPAGDQGDVRVVAPRPGTLVLFPSFVFHRTIAFTTDVQRVTVAFDFRPAG